jgi:hypothetical protein
MQDPDIISNIEGIEFLTLPVQNVMVTIVEQPMSSEQLCKLQELVVSPEQSVSFEKETRLQSESNLWFSLRQTRLTASKVGLICKRRKDFEKLCSQLVRKFRATKAMKEGTYREPLAAVAYTSILNYSINLYPCGLVISPHCYWIAASPDRKVFNPERQPPHVLLEIKCPQSQHISEVKCLTAVDTPTGKLYKLKTSDNYYFQVMCQLAVTGLNWCDFFIYLENNEFHLETIYFDESFWQEAQTKLNMFFFSHFVMYENE